MGARLNCIALRAAAIKRSQDESDVHDTVARKFRRHHLEKNFARQAVNRKCTVRAQVFHSERRSAQRSSVSPIERCSKLKARTEGREPTVEPWLDGRADADTTLELPMRGFRLAAAAVLLSADRSCRARRRRSRLDSDEATLFRVFLKDGTLARQLRRARARRRSCRLFDADLRRGRQSAAAPRDTSRPTMSTGTGRRVTRSRHARRATWPRGPTAITRC